MAAPAPTSWTERMTPFARFAGRTPGTARPVSYRRPRWLAMNNTWRFSRSAGGSSVKAPVEPASWERISTALTLLPKRAAAIRLLLCGRPLLRSTSSTSPMRTAWRRQPSLRSFPAPRRLSAPAERTAFAAMPGTLMPRLIRWRLRCAGAFAMSIISSAPCPTAPACARRKLIRCAAASWRPRFISTT